MRAASSISEAGSAVGRHSTLHTIFALDISRWRTVGAATGRITGNLDGTAPSRHLEPTRTTAANSPRIDQTGVVRQQFAYSHIGELIVVEADVAGGVISADTTATDAGQTGVVGLVETGSTSGADTEIGGVAYAAAFQTFEAGCLAEALHVTGLAAGMVAAAWARNSA